MFQPKLQRLQSKSVPNEDVTDGRYTLYWEVQIEVHQAETRQVSAEAQEIAVQPQNDVSFAANITSHSRQCNAEIQESENQREERREIVPSVGIEAEIDKSQSWCQEYGGDSTRVVVGP